MEEKQPAQRRPHDLTGGPIARTLLLFALPVLGSNVLQSLNGSINAVWVGRFLGESALTATSNANLVLFLLLGTVFGIGMAATILVAQSVGARDMHEARRIVGTSAGFFFAVSAVFASCGWIWVDAILNLLGTPPDALPLAHAYLRIIFVAVPAMNLLTFVMTILRGASAAALYGSAAGNGAIVITTKRGGKDRLSVSVNSGAVVEHAWSLPKFQNTYGQGVSGNIDPTAGQSWGAKM